MLPYMCVVSHILAVLVMFKAKDRVSLVSSTATLEESVDVYYVCRHDHVSKTITIDKMKMYFK